MKIVAAFDSFKESMSAYEAGLAVQRATDHEVIIKPMADGGEGTLEAIKSFLKGDIHNLEVHGPFNKTKASLLIADKIAIIECAQACGLDLVAEDKRNGSKTTTRGIGDMVRYAYDHGAREFIITLGGSSTNDGGAGFLSSLGVEFYNKDGQFIPTGETLSSIEDIRVPQFKNMSFKGICDVNNPLLGKQGATMVFGAQKGVKDLELQEKAMTHYANKSAEVLHKDERNYPGAGAAGGLGFAIVAYLNGELVGGFDEVARLSHLEEAIKEADLVFTGEGSMDHQTLMGKTPQGVLELAKKYNKKVVGFAGKVEDKEALLEAGFYDIRCINHQEAPLHELLKKGASNLEQEVREYLKHYEI